MQETRNTVQKNKKYLNFISSHKMWLLIHDYGEIASEQIFLKCPILKNQI